MLVLSVYLVLLTGVSSQLGTVFNNFTDYDFVKVEAFELTDEQAKKCGSTGYFADETDCCHYVQCDGDEWEGWRQFCMGGTVWNPDLCSCVHPDDYPECDPSTCSFDNEAGLERPECPPVEELAQQDKCCLQGANGTTLNQIYTKLDDLTFQLNGGYPQSCPVEGDEQQTFMLDTCCCEGELRRVPCPCLRFSFDRAHDYHHPLYDDQGIYSDTQGVIWMSPGAPPSIGIGAMFSGPGSSFRVNRYANVDFRSNFTVSFWFNPMAIYETILFHNGGPGGEDATISIEIANVNGAVIVAGFKSLDGTADIISSPDKIVPRQYNFIALVYNCGEITLVLNDDAPVAAFENEDLKTNELKTLFSSTQSAVNRAAGSIVLNEIEDADIEAEVNTLLEDVNKAIEEADDFIQDDAGGLFNFINTKKAFRSVSNEFATRPFQRDGLAGELEGQINQIKDAQSRQKSLAGKLRQLSRQIKDLLKTYEDEEDPGLEQIKTLSKKFGKLKTRINDLDAPLAKFSGGDGTKTRLDIEIQEAEELLDAFNTGRRKRDASGSSDGVPILPSKEPISFGEDFDGMFDEMIVCNYAATLDQLERQKNDGAALYTP